MATTKVIKDLTEFNPGNPDYILNATNAVTVINSGGNQYNFNGVYGKFGLRIGTTVLTGVPSGHPIAVLNNGLTGITYTGTVNEGTLAVGGVTYTFYSGDVTITVTTDFGVASYYCKIHGYMGGQDNLVSVYSTAGLKMPTGNSAYAAPPTVAEGMMRNEVGQISEGSVSCMQHFNGAEWKNFVNKTPVPVVRWVATTNNGLSFTKDATAATGWTAVSPSPFGGRGESVLYNGTAWVATGRSTTSAAYSSDGETWTALSGVGAGGSGVGWNGTYWLFTTDTTAYYTNDATGATGWTVVTNGLDGNAAASANNILWDGSDWLVAGSDLWRINGSSPNGTAVTVLSSDEWYNIAWQGSTGNVIVGTRNSNLTNAYYMATFTSTPVSATISTDGVQTGVGATASGAIIGSTTPKIRYSSNGVSYTDGGSFYIAGCNFNGTITVIGNGSNISGGIKIITGENINQDVAAITDTATGLSTDVRFVASDSDEYRYV